jgi:hypothetical protein
MVDGWRRSVRLTHIDLALSYAVLAYLVEGGTVMGRKFEEFTAEIDIRIRGQVAKASDLTDAQTPARWLLLGSKLSFYPEAWLAYLERIDPEARGRPERLYFVVQERGSNERLRLVPMANEIGSVDRANRECGLALPKEESELETAVIDYLNFYYAFTPQYDPLLANLDEGPTHFGVPLTVDDIRFEQGGASSGGSTPTACSDQCLARGAVWHYLNKEVNDRFAAIRLRTRTVPYLRLTGRIVIQFRRGLFAADFRLPLSTNTPALGNPELLYESTTLRAPYVYPRPTIRLHGYLGLGDLWRALKATALQIVALIGAASIAAIAWTLTVLLSLVWLLTSVFPFVEMTGWHGSRAIFYLIGLPFGFEDWAHSLRAISFFAIAAFLSTIFYLTHMDKIFNLLFWLWPRAHRLWLAEKLVERVSRRDRELIAQDTFRKRAFWVLRRLLYWTIVVTLLEQAAINVPLILYVLIRVPGLIENLDPVADGILSAQLLSWFHVATVVIVIKGIYRIWTFTVDASPNAFYRRLPVTNRNSGGDIDVTT